jgi:PPOX class probable F420-dependent enzyme
MKPELRELFERPNVVHVATILPDGSPHSVPVWARLEDGDHVAFFTQPTSRKARNLAADPRVAISVHDHENPYWMGQARGRVVETLEGEPALEVIDRLATDYTGKPFPMRSGIVYLVAIEKEQTMKLPFEPPSEG